ncbi:MAG: VOC family protein [Rhodospirillaceae bacterium]|jgi:lactoylglutathione lyase|nr:VOC family protein [Rhodospirillaceae bacterium]MBT5457170.1 VOC family protein [Rhodospirillaceae bacterium]
MSKLRHIAIIVPDPEEARQFFEDAFGMVAVGTARRGIYVSDGTLNIALLKQEHPEEALGIAHFGIWVDDLDTAEERIAAAGGSYVTGRPTSPNSFYEAKFKTPTGQLFDVTHTGWAGAVRDVAPVDV